MGALRLVSGIQRDLQGKKDYINHLISSEPKTGVLFNLYELTVECSHQ